MSLESHESITIDLRTTLVSILRIVNSPGVPSKQVAAIKAIANAAARHIIDEIARMEAGE